MTREYTGMCFKFDTRGTCSSFYFKFSIVMAIFNISLFTFYNEKWKIRFTD